MARLCLSFLGPAHISLDGQPCLLTPRLLGLLAYLAVEGGRPHRRESLAALFWPERPDSLALGSLRSALRDLRAALREQQGQYAPLTATASEIRLCHGPDCWTDVAAFSALLASQNNGALNLAELQQGVALYRGPFLDGFALSASAEWEEWVLIQREALQRQALGALSALASAHEGRGDHDLAIASWRRAIELEPSQEQAHGQLMRLLALAGHRSAAIAQFRRCEQMLQRDLGVKPGPETIALYERIRDGTLTDPHARVPTRGEGATARVAAADRGGPAARAPSPSDPSGEEPIALVARDQELARLEHQLACALGAQGRVILVTGEAGSGKTALVEAFSRQAMRAQPDLLVAMSRCSARRGAGDPYQPFREIVHMLVLGPDDGALPGEARGDGASTGGAATARLTVGALDGEHSRRLRAAQPVALAALAQEGPDVVRLVAHGESLVARARAYAQDGTAWAAGMEALVAQAESSALPGRQQSAIQDQFTSMLRAVAQAQPLLLVLEDLQWADDPSLDLLFHLGRHLRDTRILIVGTFRPEDDRHQPGRTPADAAAAGSQHPLEALGDEFRREWGDIRVDLAQSEGRQFVSDYLDTLPNLLGDRFRETLYDHTAGNALFTVELVRAMQERGDLIRDDAGRWVEGPHLAWEQLPPRVEGAIAQRIGRLTEAQLQLLTVASVEGVDFHAEVLARVVGEPEYAVIAALSGALGRERQLVEALDIKDVAASPRGARAPSGGRASRSHYRFRHELFQGYLYGRLDAAHRAYLHGRVGHALEELYGDQARQLAGHLARHFEIAGEARKAATYLIEAGRQAAHVAAHRAAIDCYGRALALLETLPDDDERAELELGLQVARDDSLLFSRGWGTEERLRSTARAYELGQRLGWSSPTMLRALRAIADLSAARGDYARAIKLSGELLAAAEALDSPLYVASAHAILGVCAVVQGDLPQAWNHASQAMAYSLHPPRTLTAEEMQSLRPHAEVAAVSVLLARGYLDRARQAMEQIAAGKDWQTPQITAYVHNIAAIFYALRREEQPAREQAEKALRAIEGAEMPELQTMGERILGWADARSGHTARGIARMKASVIGHPAPGTLIFYFAQLAFLAEACLAGGDTDAALGAVEQGLAEAERTGARYYEAELVRLKGEATLQREQAADAAASAEAQAEAHFRQAIDLARQLGMRLWELRATVSLARLWIRAGRPQEARAALEAVYATFTEGFTTPDLVEAAVLLKALEGERG